MLFFVGYNSSFPKLLKESEFINENFPFFTIIYYIWKFYVGSLPLGPYLPHHDFALWINGLMDFQRDYSHK